MTRGNQREVDRQKAQNKVDAKKKAEGRGGDPLKRNENDAAALQAKVAAKQAQKSESASANDASTKGPIVPKKAIKKEDANNLQNLLMDGMPKKKQQPVGSAK